jgi:hypothetical protein
LVLRYMAWSHLDGIFLSVLEELDPNLTAELRCLELETTIAALVRSLRRLVWMLVLYPLPFLMSWIPMIGRLAWPSVTFYLMQRRVGVARAFVCAVLTSLPSGIGTAATSLMQGRTYIKPNNLI